MTPDYILRKSLCREPNCGPYTLESRISEIENMGFAKEYAEPGYSQPDKAILFANWNYFPRGIDTILENYGFAIEWSDEWSTCEDCGKAVRTNPDCWDWKPSFALVGDCTLLCLDCKAKNE